MAEFPVATIELDDRQVRGFMAQFPHKVERGIRKITLLIEAKAVKLAPFARFAGGSRGGRKGTNLKSSGTSDISGSGFETVGTVKFTAPYAIYVHEGTGIYGPKQKPFVVEAKNKKALFWPGAPHPFKKVTIRGMRARPFLKQAFEEEAEKLGDLIFG